MTDIIDTNGKEIKSEDELRKENSIKLLNELSKKISTSDEKIFSLYIMLKQGDSYMRYSLGSDNVMEDIAQLELLKHSLITRMAQEK
tara:strand:+ start:3307 stop:3567 length:261 start_codon:yes stop_codon:yes gene_type:complete